MSSGINSLALEQTRRALDIFEQLETVLTNLEDYKNSLVLDPKDLAEFDVHLARLKAVIAIVEDTDTPLNFSTLTTKRTKIERLGLAKDVINAYYKEGKTLQEIQDQYQDVLSSGAVATFIKTYNKYSPKEQAEAYRSKDSVFDTREQLERLLTMINTQLVRLQYSNDPKQQENHRGYVAELRQLLKLAADFRKDIAAMLQEQQFKQDVSTILLSVLEPHQREAALDLLRKYQSGGLASVTLDVHIAESKGHLSPMPPAKDDTCTAMDDTPLSIDLL